MCIEEKKKCLPLGFPGGSAGKKIPPAMRETFVGRVSWRREQATHSSILAWRILRTVYVMGSQIVGHDWATFTCTCTLFPPATWGSLAFLPVTLSRANANIQTFIVLITYQKNWLIDFQIIDCYNIANESMHVCLVASVVSDSLQPHGLQPTRLLSPWNSPGKNTGVGCHVLLQGNFPTQWLNTYLLHLLHCRQILYPLSHLGSPI